MKTMSNDAKPEQKLENRGTNRSRTPNSPEFLAYIGSNWAEPNSDLPALHPAAPYAAARRKAEREAAAAAKAAAETAKTATVDPLIQGESA